MSELLGLARRMVTALADGTGRQQREEIERQFIEELTFAAADEIVDMLRAMLEEDWMGLPPWARNLAFRLACLQRPDDAELRRVAAADLIAFGPDWNDVADELEREADRIEGR
ncbi:hypothetical protein [Micromonospora sp. CB01531]|uniref:hypothetical protein n=1 Tax=Micromonospora sp. CB01531 TaxID=1718947 RepID=UPI001F51F2AE|nr:hypothetical protein [Micromonospora sp. CB01531]